MKVVNALDPTESTSPSFQTQLNNSDALGNVMLTPEILYQNDTINYDVTIPGNALSAGPITIASGKTVTVGADGTWVIV
jgi:hypothetical protein